MVGKTLGHYEILSPLGEGGMGQVYRARDTTLDRDVAIKVLPEDFASDPARLARFEREAKLLASLNHPNIATIFGFEESDGVHFIAMELVEGQSLAERIEASGRIDVDEALETARRIALALEAAHEAGVIHRDLKPANVQVAPDGTVKVLDFGIAKVQEPEGSSDLSQSPTAMLPTATGVIMGTAPYMSPEQARGQPVDKRTDIWSFGCVLYEMLTGDRAFERGTHADTLSAILGHDPGWDDLPADVPTTVRTLVIRTLQKNANRRLRDIGDARLEIEDAIDHRVGLRVARPSRGGAGGAVDMDTGHIDSIAVLPLTNLSNDIEQEYFSDGMTEALITDLAKIRALKVISRTSVMRYKGSDKPLPEIARELGVKGIVEGSVLRAGDRVRITAQLIDAASDTHLWAESYDRELRNILSLQGEVAHAIAQEVKVKLTPQEETRLVSKSTVNPAAHEAYLKGRYFWNQRGPGLKKSIELFERALVHDEHYAPAYAGLADAYALLGFYAYAPPREVMLKAKAAALKALEIDEHLAEAHASLGYIYMTFEWERDKAVRELQRALELNPSYGPAHIWYGVWLWSAGRLEEADAEFRRGLERDPLSAVIHTHLGIGLMLAHKYAEASQQLLQGLELDPDDAVARASLGLAYHFQSRFEDGIRELQRAVDSSGRRAWPLGTLGMVYAANGYAEEAQTVLSELKDRAQKEYIDAVWVASIHALLGEKDGAFEWLERALDERSSFVGTFQWTQPLSAFGSLADDARFHDLVRRIGSGG